jgi:FMN phosphatase YigB (HAD superfamily)
VTFDVFAALMQTEASLTAGVAGVLGARANASTVAQLVDGWLGYYGSYMVAGRDLFNASTQGPEPFQWVIRGGLEALLAQLALPVAPGSAAFEALCECWGDLVPFANTSATLALLGSRVLVAALSNGDEGTLRNATRIFQPPLHATYSSDYPVGAFKPNARIYEQVVAEFGADAVLHVAGSPVDAWGARSYGIYSAFLHEEAPLPGPQPCWLLGDISEVPGILGF